VLIVAANLFAQDNQYPKGRFMLKKSSVVDRENKNSVLENEVIKSDYVYEYQMLFVQTKLGIAFGDNNWNRIDIEGILNYKFLNEGDFVYAEIYTHLGKIWVDLLEKRITQIPIASVRIEYPTSENPENIFLLRASELSLKEIPTDIFTIKNIGVLELYKNQIQSISPEIAQLNKLEKLILSDNKIASIPKEIGLLSNLYELNLNYNQLSDLPKEISKLQNLKLLELKGNSFDYQKKNEIKKWFEKSNCKVDFGDDSYDGMD
jgi:Leucine-rich repeat (LRR) protein